MPTYLYHCDACNSEFEKEQRIVEPPIKKCANCGKSKARRLITGGNFILKGGGWYSDGYGSSKTSNSSSSSSESSSKSSSPKTEAKTEAKTETKTEKKSDGGETTKPAQSSSSD